MPVFLSSLAESGSGGVGLLPPLSWGRADAGRLSPSLLGGARWRSAFSDSGGGGVEDRLFPLLGRGGVGEDMRLDRTSEGRDVACARWRTTYGASRQGRGSGSRGPSRSWSPPGRTTWRWLRSCSSS